MVKKAATTTTKTDKKLSKDKIAEMYLATIPTDEKMKTQSDEDNWREHKEAFQNLLKKKGKTTNDSSDKQSFIRIGIKLNKLKPRAQGNTTAKPSTKTKPATGDFFAFTEAIKGVQIDAETLQAAIEFINKVDGVEQAQTNFAKWSALLEECGGNVEAAHKIVALLK